MNYEDFMKGLVRRNPGEHEFHQAVGEVAMSVIPFIEGGEGVSEVRSDPFCNDVPLQLGHGSNLVMASAFC